MPDTAAAKPAPVTEATKPARVVDAATLLLLDRSQGDRIRVLMGMRSGRHAFMANKLVFPGGRTEASDGAVRWTSDDVLPAADLERMKADTHRRFTDRRARAIVCSAIRETQEETAILVGRRDRSFAAPSPIWSSFEQSGVMPSAAQLRFVARAITPPGRVRRYDTRFFAGWRDEVVVEREDGAPVTDELGALRWVALDEALTDDTVPGVTKLILDLLKKRLDADPDLSADRPVPFMRFLNNKRMLTDI